MLLTTQSKSLQLTTDPIEERFNECFTRKIECIEVQKALKKYQIPVKEFAKHVLCDVVRAVQVQCTQGGRFPSVHPLRGLRYIIEKNPVQRENWLGVFFQSLCAQTFLFKVYPTCLSSKRCTFNHGLSVTQWQKEKLEVAGFFVATTGSKVRPKCVEFDSKCTLVS